MREKMSCLDTTHLRELTLWAKRSSQSNNLFLVESLAPIVLGVKPSELLNVAQVEKDLWEEFKSLFMKNQELKVKEIRELNGRLQVIFFQSRVLDSVLREESIQDFLGTMSYPKKYSLESYLNLLKKRIISDDFPHEVGVFLGYPLKDVLGFMGILTLPYRETMGWRIYGDEKPSIEVYSKYAQARSIMKKIAEGID